MVNLNQYDARWANIKLSPSNLTCGRYGCLTSVICDFSDFFKCFVTPLQAIGVNIKYTADGMIDWTELNFPKFKLQARIREFNQPTIDFALKSPNMTVAININNGAHWVAAVGKLPLGYYRIFDPWGGKVKIINKNQIVGFASFIAKP